MAIGLDGRGLLLQGGRHDGTAIGELAGRPLNCPTAALFLDPDRLLVANGSAACLAADWKRDLMSRGASGSIWRIDLSSGKPAATPWPTAWPIPPASRVAPARLSWSRKPGATGCSTSTGAVLQPVLADLPAYPGRIPRQRPAAIGSPFSRRATSSSNSSCASIATASACWSGSIPPIWIAPSC